MYIFIILGFLFVFLIILPIISWIFECLENLYTTKLWEKKKKCANIIEDIKYLNTLLKDVEDLYTSQYSKKKDLENEIYNLKKQKDEFIREIYSYKSYINYYQIKIGEYQKKVSNLKNVDSNSIVKISRNGTYHKGLCQYVTNDMISISEIEAISAGYKKCSYCCKNKNIKYFHYKFK